VINTVFAIDVKFYHGKVQANCPEEIISFYALLIHFTVAKLSITALLWQIEDLLCASGMDPAACSAPFNNKAALTKGRQLGGSLIKILHLIFGIH